MAKEEEKGLGANELNIDGFFGPDAGFVGVETDEKDESLEKESGEADELDTSEGTDDEDLDDSELDDGEGDVDDDLEDDSDDSGDTDQKPKKPAEAERKANKQAATAEAQRKDIQSKYDTLTHNFNQQTAEISKLRGEVEGVKTKANDSAVEDLFSGDDETVVTEGQVKKIIEASRTAAPKPPPVGTDAEAQQMWANSQTDVAEVNDFFNKNQLSNDPELLGLRTIEGRYEKVRNKILQEKINKRDLKIKKQRKLIDKIKKGSIPNTVSGGRNSAQGQPGKEGDALDRFFGS